MCPENHDSQKPAPDQIPSILQTLGVSGAGGAGFPSYVKWQNLDDIDYLLINLEEGEPVFYGDKWLVTNNLKIYREAIDYLLANVFKTIVIASKKSYRQEWFGELEEVLNPEVVSDLPVDVSKKQGLLLAYTGDRYELSQETALLWTTAGIQLGGKLPTKNGWIVQNAETFFNIANALLCNKPVTRKQVAVFGPDIPHAYFNVPVGTLAVELLAEMNISDPKLEKDYVLLDGGPGWCSEINGPQQQFGVSKRTNGIMLAPADYPERYRDPREPERINALAALDWKNQEHQKKPTYFEPDRVHIPLISNPALSDYVERSIPVVKKDQQVNIGDVIARPAENKYSIAQHASITGRIMEITETYVKIKKST